MLDKIKELWGTTSGKVVLILLPLMLLVFLWMNFTKSGKRFKSKHFGKKTVRRRRRTPRRSTRRWKMGTSMRRMVRRSPRKFVRPYVFRKVNVKRSR